MKSIFHSAVFMLAVLLVGCSSLEERSEQAAIRHAKFIANELPAVLHNKPKTEHELAYWTGEWQPLDCFSYALKDPRVREVRVNRPTDPNFFALYGSLFNVWQALDANSAYVKVRGDVKIRSRQGVVKVELESPQGLVQVLLAPSTQSAKSWEVRRAYVETSLETQDWEGFAQKLAAAVGKGPENRAEVGKLCKETRLYPILDHVSVSIIEPRFLKMALSQDTEPTLQRVFDWKAAEDSKAAEGRIDYRGRWKNFNVIVTKPSEDTDRRSMTLKRRVFAGGKIVQMTFTLLAPEWVNVDYEPE